MFPPRRRPDGGHPAARESGRTRHAERGARLEDPPSWYLVAGSDKAIPAAAERFMAKRAKAHTTEIKGASHVVMISHPDATADLITAAARATS
ncbi:alpha/beta fold hydrolase [Streptosporangium lutulentum]